MSEGLAAKLRQFQQQVDRPKKYVVEGRLTRIVGMTLEAVGCRAPIGARCIIKDSGGSEHTAEVVGFTENKMYLMPTADVYGIEPGARVIPTGHVTSIGVGEQLLGRVLDGDGQPIDGKGPIEVSHQVSLMGQPLNPLQRAPIDTTLDVGVKAINGLLTVGTGQRMGLFAGSGVGKSVLLGMMTRFTEAEIVVVGLIGERGREVQEFIQESLGEEGLKRSVVVAVPADQSPLMRYNGAMAATSIAEHFRDQGKKVLLLMDSLTRFCQAQREISLAIGEPPATKGYPPSVFAKLPKLVERAGNSHVGGGSITAFYTVLAEGDDQQDPIADAARAILDGHIVLSRRIADSGHYPAIDIEHSISRAMNQVVPPDWIDFARQFKQVYSTYQQNKDLISVGAYQQGSDPAIDEAIMMNQHLQAFLDQGMHDKYTTTESLTQLTQLMTSV
jgi:flagellum-specific ATP synthase